MKSRFSMTETTLDEARAKAARFEKHLVHGSPLRFRPVVVVGPNEGFIVIEAGIAIAEGFEIV
jgi:hypothetical protein